MTVATKIHVAMIRTADSLSAPVHHRGMHRVVWTLGRAFGHDQRVQRTLPEGDLWLYLDDNFWFYLLRPGWRYEPDVEAALRRLLTPETYFIDGGANIGYWSMISSTIARDVVAIEASPDTYRRLVDNAALNGDRWASVHAALWDKAGETITFHSNPRFHAGATAVDDAAHPGSVPTDVQTATIDSIVAEHAPDPARKVVIKLDVEGAEIAALRGAADTLASRDTVLIYEDHGKDPTHAVTRFLADELGMTIETLNEDGTSRRIASIDELDAIKTDPFHGYNFLASRV